MKTHTGIVVSTKMAKTVVVALARQHVHPLYKKIIHRTTRVKAHCTLSDVAVGDRIVIRQTRPLSRDKHFIVVKKET